MNTETGSKQNYLVGKDRNPSQINERGIKWLIYYGIDGFDHDTYMEKCDRYLEEHDVMRLEETEEWQAPDSDNMKVKNADILACRILDLEGNWIIHEKSGKIDDLWKKVVSQVDKGEFLNSKVSTSWAAKKGKNENRHALMVETPNYFDTEDVFRVRELLRGECGVNGEIGYKPTGYSRAGIYPSNYWKRGLPSAYRFKA